MTWELNQAAIRGDFLMHHGVKGQRRGHRRFQNPDGSLTPEGREHYGVGEGNAGYGNNKFQKKYNRDIKNLKKLDDRANLRLQTEKANKLNRRAATAAKAGVNLIGGGYASARVANALSAKDHSLRYLHEQYGNTEYSLAKYLNDRGSKNAAAYRNSLGDDHRRWAEGLGERANRTQQIGSILGESLVAAGLGSLAFAGVSKAQASVAKKRTTVVGHAKAVAKRQEAYKRMEKTYAQTPYADLLKKENDAIKKNR